MKKHMLRLTLMAFVTLSAFSACKKDKDENLAVTSENLVGNYTLADIKVKAAGQEQSIIGDVPACAKDDVLQLKTGGVLQIVDEGTTCDNDETSTWSLEGNKITIDASVLDITGPYDVITFNKSQLVLSMTYTEGGVSFSYVVYLNRK
ncbi:MAG: lipocalin family protein [Chitinophagaceae bacterium]|nr:lipocalin family protein [Chitinophagaceae bacterium]